MKGLSTSGETFGKFETEDRVFVGMVSGGSVVELDAERISELFDGSPERTSRSHQMAMLKVLPPVDKPSKIICIGLNYRSHIEEMGWQTPKEPIIFSKPSSAIIGQDEDIVLPPASKRVDLEGESAAMVGRRARKVSDGGRFIFGYTAFNDVTARDLQKVDPDWTRAKGFDTFAPIGPFISKTPPMTVVTRLNGDTVQRSPTSDRVFDDGTLVEYISSVMTLEPGDVIATGTPSGIAPISDGDVVEVELDGIGVLRNRVRANHGNENGVDV